MLSMIYWTVSVQLRSKQKQQKVEQTRLHRLLQL